MFWVVPVALETRSQEHLKAEFAAWYFDPDRVGTQKQWAEEHGCGASTLTAWKSEDWFIAEQEKWKERLDRHFGMVMYAAYKRATDTDSFNNSQIQAARFIADMLGKTPPKKVDHRVDVFTFLEQLPSGEEDGSEGVLGQLPPGT